jgi:hypothetical protein
MFCTLLNQFSKSGEKSKFCRTHTAISRSMTRSSLASWVFWISLVAILALARGQSVCQEDGDCAAPEVCLYGMCYEVKAAPPGTDVRCEDVCPETGRCVGNICDVKPAAENAGQSADAVSDEADASPTQESGSQKGTTLGLVGIFLGVMGVLTA